MKGTCSCSDVCAFFVDILDFKRKPRTEIFEKKTVELSSPEVVFIKCLSDKAHEMCFLSCNCDF